MTNDFKWKVHKDPARLGQELWQIVTGKTLVTICRSEEAAVEMCENLNNDRWFLDRGQTRKDRWG
tara:strand:+ start:563 stop:757 length:195 start_codon:yes stop_codon:yes gene_type:complete